MYSDELSKSRDGGSLAERAAFQLTVTSAISFESILLLLNTSGTPYVFQSSTIPLRSIVSSSLSLSLSLLSPSQWLRQPKVEARRLSNHSAASCKRASGSGSSLLGFGRRCFVFLALLIFCCDGLLVGFLTAEVKSRRIVSNSSDVLLDISSSIIALPLCAGLWCFEGDAYGLSSS